jgi:hypothetical protein
MKYIMFFILALSTFFLKAQQPAAVVLDSTMQKSVDSLHKIWTDLSFEKKQFNTYEMTNDYQQPLVMQLEANQIYLISFIGKPGGTSYEAILYDWEENTMASVKTKKRYDDFSHIAIISFKPTQSGYYILQTYQKHSKGKMLKAVAMLYQAKNKTEK